MLAFVGGFCMKNSEDCIFESPYEKGKTAWGENRALQSVFGKKNMKEFANCG